MVERIVRALAVELLEEAEPPQLVDPAVHARDVERVGVRAGLERGLVAGPHVGDEVLERALDRVELALPPALLARHLAGGDLALLVDPLLADDALVVLERHRRGDAGRPMLAALLAVLAVVGDQAAAADPAHREHARVLLAGAFVAVVAALALDRALGGLVLARVIGLADVLVRGRLGLLELADLVVGAADVGARVIVALARRDGLALGLLVEVGLL